MALIARRAGRFLRTPKGLLLILLVLLTAIAAPAAGPRLVLPLAAAAVVAGALIDLPILRLRSGRWEFPSGAILTGLIVAMVLSPREPWYVGAVTSAIGVAAKYVFRTRRANVFNPAALGLVVTFYIFDTGQSWWGAVTESVPVGVASLFVTGTFIAERVSKLPLVVSFLGVYFSLFTAAAYLTDPGRVAEIFRAPDLQAVLYFAFFILSDPPTSPAPHRPQLICGVVVAVAAFAIFQWTGAAHYLLSAVLVGNVWEAWRRVSSRKDSP